MRRTRSVGWLCLVIWAVWLVGLQAYLADPELLGAWVPELGVLLFLAVDGRMRTQHSIYVALVLALVRCAFSVDSPLAVVAGYLFIYGICRTLRTILEVDELLPRTLLAALLSFGLATFLHAVRAFRLQGEGLALSPAESPWPMALATAVVSLLALPLFARLPGLLPLWRRA